MKTWVKFIKMLIPRYISKIKRLKIIKTYVKVMKTLLKFQMKTK